MPTLLRMLAAAADELLSTRAPRPAWEPASPPPFGIPEFDWRAACHANAARTGAPLADAERGLTDALRILDALAPDDDEGGRG